jgi:hypothetical protein
MPVQKPASAGFCLLRRPAQACRHGMGDYPFLHNITNLLVDIGYYGTLSENGDSLFLTEIPLCKASVDASGKKKSPKISASAKSECLL